MIKEKILVIDDDAYVTQLLAQILAREQYEVFIARNSEEALAQVSAIEPHLIILDLMLPDGDGYDLLEKIKNARGAAFFPVMVLTASHELEDKLRGLRLGVIDYITKPFDRQDLRRRVESVIEGSRAKIGERAGNARRHPKSNGKQGNNGAAISHRQVLSAFENGKLQTLEPRLCREAKLGYDYPDIAGVIRPEEPGGEITTLEEMAAARLLERTFVDAIQVCPACGHHNVNFRKACPYCLSVDLETDNTEHNNGVMPPLDESLSGLYKIEHDDNYARSSSSSNSAAFFCAACQRTYTRTRSVFRCMNCGRQFDADKALTKRIYSYKPRHEAFKSASPAVATDATGQWGKLPALFRKFELPLLDSQAFTRQVNAQVENARQRNSNFSLIGLHLKNIFGEEASVEPIDRTERAYELLDALKKSLRRFDAIGLRSQTDWMILLPETPFTMAKILASRLYAACERMAWEQPLDLSLASYPEDGVRAEELLEVLQWGIVTMPKG